MSRFASFPSGAVVTPGSITLSELARNARPLQNIAGNPYLCDATLHGSSEAPASFDGNDETQIVDAWKLQRGNADVDMALIDPGASQAAARCALRITKDTSAGKILLASFFDGETSRGTNLWSAMSFQLALRADPAADIRIGFIGQSGGAIDTIPSPMVTAFNADGVDPTLDANLSFASLVTASVGTSYGEFIVSGGVLSFFNKGLVLFTDDEMAVGDLIEVGVPIAFDGTELRDFVTPSAGETWANSKRFAEKSYNNAVTPGTASALGQIRFVAPDATFKYPVQFDTRKIKAPTVGLYSPVTGAGGPRNGSGSLTIRDYSGGADIVAGLTLADVGEEGFTLEVGAGAGLAGGEDLGFHFLADARL